MSILVTVVGVVLGYAYVALVHRRTGRGAPRRWMPLALVPVVYVVLLAAGVDMAEPGPRFVQAFTIATVLGTVVRLVEERRRAPAAGDAARTEDRATGARATRGPRGS